VPYMDWGKENRYVGWTYLMYLIGSPCVAKPSCKTSFENLNLGANQVSGGLSSEVAILSDAFGVDESNKTLKRHVDFALLVRLQLKRADESGIFSLFSSSLAMHVPPFNKTD